jgi:hypothetical protein
MTTQRETQYFGGPFDGVRAQYVDLSEAHQARALGVVGRIEPYLTTSGGSYVWCERSGLVKWVAA